MCTLIDLSSFAPPVEVQGSNDFYFRHVHDPCSIHCTYIDTYINARVLGFCTGPLILSGGGVTADLLLQQLSAWRRRGTGKPFIYDIIYVCNIYNIYIFFSPCCCGKRHKSVRGYFRQGLRGRHGRSAP